MASELSPAQEVTVRRFGSEGSEVAVFAFEGELRDLVVSSLRDGFLSTGSYTPDARALAPQSVQSLVFAGGGAIATGLSGSFSSTLFMATANPATLMQLGSGGFSSAIMGATGIVGHAGFVPVAASFPVVAPLIAMQAIQTTVILQQFKQVHQKLDEIKRVLDEAIARAEATHAGELIAASEMVEEVYRQYESTGVFSPDMLIRLALAERDLRALAQRFRFLVDGQRIGEIDDLTGFQRANYDAHSAMLSSFLELRIAYLRVCIDMQESPQTAATSVERLKARIESGVEFWERMLQRSETLKKEIIERETKLKDMSFVGRTFGQGAAADRKLKTLREAYTVTLESELAIVKGFDALIRTAKRTLAELEHPSTPSGSSPTLVYWQDELGEHSLSTHQLDVVAKPAG